MLDRARVTIGTQVLEVGTGWGALAVAAARRGAHVTTLTLSTEQAAHTQQWVERADVADRVDIRLSDYRDVVGTFEAVVSVEMLESVGEACWPAYFSAFDRVLAPGGLVVVQSILSTDERFQATRGQYGWAQKHIAPGTRVPSVQAVQRCCRAHTRLQVGEVLRFGPHYAETLRRWRTALQARWPHVDQREFSDAVRRKWEYYLESREARLTLGQLDVGLLVLQRDSV